MKDWDSFELVLKSSEEAEANYVAQLYMSMDSVRLTIDEVARPGRRKRYRVRDVVMIPSGESNSSLVVTEATSEGAVLRVPSGYLIDVIYSRFELRIVSRNGEEIQTVNSNNYFAFERFRDNFGDRCPSGTRLDMACATSQHGGLWKEDFDGGSDIKKYGPSAVGVDIRFPTARSVFGLPEHTLPFNLPLGEEEIRFFNVDVFRHKAGSPAALYGSIPMLTSIHSDGTTSAVLWMNPSETFVALSHEGAGVGSSWVSETGVIDVFFFLGPSPREVLRQYHTVTGFPAMPPFFALGFHQSKWGYASWGEMTQLVSRFDELDIPLDVVWLDIQHTDGKRYFTWASPEFANPELGVKGIADTGRKVVTIVDPHIKVDAKYSVFAEALVKKLFVQSSGGDDFRGHCWPGSSSYLDFTRADVRSFWSGLFSYSVYKGSSPSVFIWNDMNEPSVFESPEMTMPRGLLHGDGIEHREIHNLYGFYQHMATHEGLMKRDLDGARRPFVLSRAFFVGSHRFGPIWTGDNQANWDFLRLSIPMLLSLSVSGLSFAGADVGGFEGNPSKELFIRWHQLGAMAYPFYRCHSTLESSRREPWTFDSETLDIVRTSIQTRYALLPYWYAAFARNSMDGLPIIRPLWFDHMNDSNTWGHHIATEEEMMVGDSLLIRGIVQQGVSQVDVYLPGEEELWVNFHDDSATPGGQTISVEVTLDSIPVFVKGGSIIPLQAPRRKSTEFMKDVPISLRIYPRNGHAVGWLYLDDGYSMRYKTDSDFALVKVSFIDGFVSTELVRGTRSISELEFADIQIINTDMTSQEL
jgi:alpha 1,3-glucosidase